MALYGICSQLCDYSYIGNFSNYIKCDMLKLCSNVLCEVYIKYFFIPLQGKCGRHIWIKTYK